MPSTNYLSSLLSSFSSTSRYICLTATLAAAVFSYSFVANNINNNSTTRLTNSEMAASTTNSTHIKGVPRVLHEIGDLMRQMFFEMRDLICEKSVDSVEVVSKSHKLKYRKITVKKREDHVVCLSLVLGSGGEDEWNNMEAVFAFMMCGYSVAWMWDILKLLVRGRHWRVFEIVGTIGRCPIEARQTWLDHKGNDCRAAECAHILWLIKIADGREFAFDLTAAQFGYHRTVTPYNEYKEALQFREMKRTEPGTELSNLEQADCVMSQEDKIAKTITRRLANMVRGFVQESDQPVEPNALREHLRDTYLDNIVIAAFANHKTMVRKGQWIYMRNHPKTREELARE